MLRQDPMSSNPRANKRRRVRHLPNRLAPTWRYRVIGSRAATIALIAKMFAGFPIKVVKVDAATIDIVTPQPDPILPVRMTTLTVGYPTSPSGSSITRSAPALCQSFAKMLRPSRASSATALGWHRISARAART
jgi:hypothetical protein